MYYNQDLLSQADINELPRTWEAFDNIARKLDSKGRGRLAIQAHPGKAAAVTVFEWVKSMGGNPLTLDGPKARQAFEQLWNLAPYLAPESPEIQFDSANSVLIADQVAVVDNWTYGIKVVMRDHEKKNIKVTSGLQSSVHVLGGDVLAIPTGVPKERVERAIKLIEQLVSKKTQHAIAKHLVWAPVRGDVYTEISSQQGPQKEYFQAIREALQTAVMRPLTPDWGPVEAILSEALGKVLELRAKGKPDADATVDTLLRYFIEKLGEIPHNIEPCSVGQRASTPGDGSCPVEVPTEKTFKELASNFGTKGTILAAINGHHELDIVSPKTMKILLVPKNERVKGSRHLGGVLSKTQKDAPASPRVTARR
jgi:ABC-type glycerol-3-phosphate transport system substrate-binding protein